MFLVLPETWLGNPWKVLNVMVYSSEHSADCKNVTGSGNLTLYAPFIILQYVYKPTRCTKILVIRLYFPLDALHVSDHVSPSSGAIFYRLYIAFGICRYMPIRLALVWL